MSNAEELRNMVLNFRVSELQMLLGFAGRNRTGRKTELQARALDLLRSKSQPVQQKIKELYDTIQQNAALNPSTTGSTIQTRSATAAASSGTASADLGAPTLTPNPPVAVSMQQGGPPRATVYPMPNYGPPQSHDNRHQLQAPRMYTTQMYARYPGPANQPIMAAAQYPVHPDIVFKRLPFYDHLGDLLKPSSLMPNSTQRMQESSFVFHLTPQQATDIASNRDVGPGSKIDFVYQVQLRFCQLETSCEQEDFFPPQVTVKVNGKPCPLPNPVPTNKPGVEPKRPPRPVNITPMVKLSPTVANHINIGWAADYGKGYVIRCSMVHKLTAVQLLARLRSRGVKHSDHTTGLIKEKLSEDADCEIATTSLRVSLLCPLGKFRMKVPCRASTCGHLQCFDASVFLEMNERRATWCCPVCDKPALYDNLVIDGYFQDVLNSPRLSSSTSEIELHKDGSWQEHIQLKKEVVNTTKEEAVEIISDDIEVIPISSSDNCNQKVNSSAPAAEPKKPPVVDLTLSDSDEEDNLPLKRKVPTPTQTQQKTESKKRRIDSSSISSASSGGNRYASNSGPNSVSSSGYQSPSIITLDSPSPPLDE